MKQFLRPLTAAGFAALLSVAAAAPHPAAPTAAGSTPTKASMVLRRPPPVLGDGRLLRIHGSLFIRTQAGVPAERSVIVEYRGSTSGYLDVVPGTSALMPNPDIESLGGGRYRVTLRTSDRLAAEPHRGTLLLRMCTEMPCVNVIEGTTARPTYTVLVSWRNTGEWETFQRDAGHTGYVPVTINPLRISRIWEWQRTNPGVIPGINAVVTAPGRVFVSDDSYFHQVASLYAMHEKTGSLLWRQDFVDYPALNPPAVSNGRVYVATTGHEQTFLWSFDAEDGLPRSQSSFDGQWPHVLAPTVADGIAYTNGGYHGGGVYAFDADDGLPLWSRFSGDDDMTTPAVADGRVYFYDGGALKIYDAFDGSVLGNITDPYDDDEWGDSQHHGAPMLGSPDHVFSFSGGAFSGRASSQAEQYESRPLLDFSPAAGNVRWRTVKDYKTQPAVAEGVVYAASNDPKSFDAIDEQTGQILWSWVPGTADTEFHRNVVVTQNLAFVSTNRALYAIDLATHRPVWSSPTPGMVAISGSGIMYVVVGGSESTGQLLAFKLR